MAIQEQYILSKNPSTGTVLLPQVSNNTAFEIDNDGTGHGVHIHQDGVLASGKNGLFVESNVAQTSNSLVEIHNNNAGSTFNTINATQAGTGGVATFVQSGVLATNRAIATLQVSSSAVQNGGPLLRVLQDNSASSYNMVIFDNDGVGGAVSILQNGNLATGKYALYIDNNGTPVDGAGRCLRLDGCTISSTKNPETDAEAGFIAINVDGTQMAVPYYALS